MLFHPGGTDIIACFAGHNCTGGVYRGEIQCRMLGMAVECWDDDGNLIILFFFRILSYFYVGSVFFM